MFLTRILAPCGTSFTTTSLTKESRKALFLFIFLTKNKYSFFGFKNE